MIINLLFFFTAAAFSSESAFKEKLIEKFSPATNISYHKDVLGKNIDRPRGTWYKVLCGNMREKRFCLFYKTPYKNTLGELLFGEGGENPYSIFNKISLKGIRLFSIDKQGFQTIIKFQKSKSHRWKFDHVNIEKKSPYQRYDSPVPHSYRTGLKFGFWPETNKPLTGNINDRYGNGTAKICHKVDDNCDNIVRNTCHKCRFGHFEVVDFHCPQGGSKYCGRDLCGERGEPACPRGRQLHTGTERACFNESKAGFCQKGLNTSCDANGVLICL